MKILLAIIQRIYFAWVALTFVLLMLLAFVFIMLSQLLPKRTGLLCTNFFLRCWAFTWGLVVGLRYRHYGRKPSYKNTTMVILTNHNSFLDTPASYVQIQGAFRTLAKKELLKTPSWARYSRRRASWWTAAAPKAGVKARSAWSKPY